MNHKTLFRGKRIDNDEWEHLEIIGNIHDSPELMEVQHG